MNALTDLAHRKRRFLRVVAALAVSAYFGWQIAQNGLSYKDVIFGLSLLIGAFVVFGGEPGIRFGFVLWVLTLALGYRTIGLTRELRVHPAELLLWLLLLAVFAQRRLTETTRLSLPWWLWLFIPFWVIAWWPLMVGDAPWPRMLNEFRNFVLWLPLLIIAPVVLCRFKFWQYLVGAFFLVGSWIAIMGIIEYWFPDITNMFPAFIKNARADTTADGFVRAQFSFWGSQTATFVCALALPFGIVLARQYRLGWQRIVVAISAALQLLGIYIGGYRSVWMLVVVQAMIALIFGVKRYGLALAALCLVVAVTGYQFVPNSHERVMSSIAALQGAPIDHSTLDRKERALDALDKAVTSPLGNGWSSSGWVHSDFLQVAANLGILAAFIFLGGFLYTLFRLGSRVLLTESSQDSDHSHLGFALFLSFIAVGGLLATQGVAVLPQLVLPVWFVWTLVEVWLNQKSPVMSPSYYLGNLDSPRYARELGAAAIPLRIQ